MHKESTEQVLCEDVFHEQTAGMAQDDFSRIVSDIGGKHRQRRDAHALVRAADFRLQDCALVSFSAEGLTTE